MVGEAGLHDVDVAAHDVAVFVFLGPLVGGEAAAGKGAPVGVVTRNFVEHGAAIGKRDAEDVGGRSGGIFGGRRGAGDVAN